MRQNELDLAHYSTIDNPASNVKQFLDVRSAPPLGYYKTDRWLLNQSVFHFPPLKRKTLAVPVGKEG